MIRWAGGGPRPGRSRATASAASPAGHLAARAPTWSCRARSTSVRLRSTTLDPGTSDAPAALFDTAIDGTPSAAGNAVDRGHDRRLIIERCITGPIRARNGGAVETLYGKRQHHPVDPRTRVARRRAGARPVRPRGARSRRERIRSVSANPRRRCRRHRILRSCEAYVTAGTVPLGNAASPPSQPRLDRAAIARRWRQPIPLALADLALGFASGTVSLSRCTVLGPVRVHRMNASECILARGRPCRGSAAWLRALQRLCAGQHPARSPIARWRLPRAGPLFDSRRFGQPELRAGCGATPMPRSSAPSRATPSSAARRTAREMGAFCLERITLKRRGLAMKYQEFMPLGLTPSGSTRYSEQREGTVPWEATSRGQLRSRRGNTAPSSRSRGASRWRPTSTRQAASRQRRCAWRRSTSSARPARRTTATRSALNAAGKVTSLLGTHYLGGWRLMLDDAGRARRPARLARHAGRQLARRPTLVALLATEQSVCAVEDQALARGGARRPGHAAAHAADAAFPASARRAADLR